MWVMVRSNAYVNSRRLDVNRVDVTSMGQLVSQYEPSIDTYCMSPLASPDCTGGPWRLATIADATFQAIRQFHHLQQ